MDLYSGNDQYCPPFPRWITLYTRVAKEMYTHCKRSYLWNNFRSWITVAMRSRTFAQKMALMKWMLAAPCDRKDSQKNGGSTVVVRGACVCISFFWRSLYFVTVCIHVSVLMDRHQDSCTVRQWKIVLSHTHTLYVRCHLYFAIIY